MLFVGGVNGRLRQKLTESFLVDAFVVSFFRHARISPEEAYDKCIDKKRFRQFLSEPPIDATDE